MKTHYLFGSPVDPKLSNIVINAIAAMLIYSAHYGSCAITPIILDSMHGIGGIDEHLLFHGVGISSLFSVIMCPFITPAIDKLGTRICLILGGVMIMSLPPSLIYPIPAIFLTCEACNGAGCALLRSASLKFLTDNTPFEKLAGYNGIHWSIFMGCVLVGNCVLLIATGSNHIVDFNMRIRICLSLTSLGTLGLILYMFFIRKHITPTEEEEDENTVLFVKTKKQDTSVSSYESYETRVRPGFWDSTKRLARLSTLNLLIVMMNCAVYQSLLYTIGPMFVGHLLDNKRYVALFGICAGLGEIVGSLIAGRVIAKIGIKKSAVFVTIIGVSSVVISALSFPLKEDSPIIPPNLVLLLLLGVNLGVADATNGVMLSTLIGKIYKSYSQAGFALFACVSNMFCITIFIIITYCYFLTTVWVMLVIVCAALVAILLIKRRDMQSQTEIDYKH